VTTADDLARRVRAATVPGARGKLVARGLARGMIWRDGQLPADAPAFSPSLTTDLLDRGYSVLAQALALRDDGGHAGDAEAAFRTSAEAIESAVRKGESADPERVRHLVVAAAAFHLGHFAARSFCLVPGDLTGLNLSASERALALLMRRGLRDLRTHCVGWLADPDHSDAVVAARLERADDDFGPEDVLSLALTRNLLRGVATFDTALKTGDGAAFARAVVLQRNFSTTRWHAAV
jgi:hypothetical protein